MKIYNFHSDPGHGWLEVPLDEVKHIASKITGYSYIRGDNVYLEEDCDAGLFLDSLQTGTFKINNVYTDNDSPIRNYRHYQVA